MRFFRAKPYERKLSPRVHPICKFVWETMRREQTCSRDVADKSGVNDVTIRGWFRTYPQNPNLQNIEAVINSFDYSLIAIPTEWLPKGWKEGGLRDVRALEKLVSRAIEAEDIRHKTARNIKEQFVEAGYFADD